MTPVAKAGRSGRRSGESGTSDAILEAARAQFATRGYQGATIRAIAADAGVDPALVHHFYGTKDALFAAAMRMPVVPSEAIAAALASAPQASLGTHLVKSALTLWESAGVREAFLGLLRSAVASEEAMALLREFVADSILPTIARAPGLAEFSRAEADYRVSLVASQILGLALTRLVIGLPAIAGASVDELAATVGPTVDRYLTGDAAVPGD
ncbi:MAG TPA: TetR family transcriptional regulator [Streptosporangiaceae bacterium]|nr:TetR family transcriptional regulator [Streptosporangiaceae bacterium]